MLPSKCRHLYTFDQRFLPGSAENMVVYVTVHEPWDGE